MQQNQPWTEERIRAELRRCAREIEAAEQQEPPGRAVLVTLGIEDWTREMRLILDMLPAEGWPYQIVDCSSLDWPERVGWPCRVLGGTSRTACVTFPDAAMAMAPWGALRFRGAAVQ